MPDSAYKTDTVSELQEESGSMFSAYSYTIVRERLFHFALGYYRSYGIRVSSRGREIDFISDVSPDLGVVTGIVERCNRHQLSPVHLLDVILDSI